LHKALKFCSFLLPPLATINSNNSSNKSNFCL
jgi:hypothetical protein